MVKLVNELLDLVDQLREYSLEVTRKDTKKVFEILKDTGIDLDVDKGFYFFSSKGDLEDALEILNKKNIKIINTKGLD